MPALSGCGGSVGVLVGVWVGVGVAVDVEVSVAVGVALEPPPSSEPHAVIVNASRRENTPR